MTMSDRPAVPTSIQVPDGNEAFLVGRGIGTRNYSCSPSGAGCAWILFTPEAVLLSDSGRQITSHFFGPNPREPNVDRPSRRTRPTTSSFAANADRDDREL